MSEVRNNEAEGRYELAVDGGMAIAAYRLRDGVGEGKGVVAFTHTEVPETLEGRGIASRLIAGALADLRARGRKAEPLCAFVAAYMKRHSETEDLLADR